MKKKEDGIHFNATLYNKLSYFDKFVTIRS